MNQISPIQVPITNGVARSFGHVRLNVNGIEFTGGVKSFKRSRKRSREDLYSNSVDPVAKTLGTNKYQASAVFYYEWFMNLLQSMGPGYGDVAFLIYCSYVGRSLVPYTDTIINCTIDVTDAADEAGNNGLTREIEFNPTKILFGGIEDAGDPLVAAAQ